MLPNRTTLLPQYYRESQASCLLEQQNPLKPKQESADHFCRLFPGEHTLFATHLSGLPPAERIRYTSLMLHRLMFLYFLQAKGFLDKNYTYLHAKLTMIATIVSRRDTEREHIPSFYRDFLLRLFHEGLSQPDAQRSPDAHTLLGNIPFLPQDFFNTHTIEETYPNLSIPDKAFERLFSFFDRYQWRIDDRESDDRNVLTPDILGSIFEKQINQKQMGAYYTQKDITYYMVRNALHPWIWQSIQKRYPEAFDPGTQHWLQLRMTPDRYILPALQQKELHPLETQYEYHQRQERYHIIKRQLQQGSSMSPHDFITYNLNSECFLQDTLTWTDDPQLLRACYESLEEITILDPTCGSGAFLFTALMFLEKLYTLCLARMEQFLDPEAKIDHIKKTGEHNLSYFQHILQQDIWRKNRAYGIVKKIASQHIYGVDLMPDAVEICKLRLGLKLASYIRDKSDLEHLWTIPLHIQQGNTLVGWLYPSDNRESADDIDQKTARVYGIKREETGNENEYQVAMNTWKNTHHPFHWCQSFSHVMQQGGFSIILGNPPYVEYNESQELYTSLQGYQTRQCGNLYATVVERSLSLCQSGQSYLSLIVPLSLCSGERFHILRQILNEKASHLWCANFEIFPSRLFEGAFQRLTILTARSAGTVDEQQQASIYTTGLQRWYKAERPQLISLLYYTPIQTHPLQTLYPKLATRQQEAILNKLYTKSKSRTISDFLCKQKTEHFVYYQEATNYWTKAGCRVPFYSKNGISRTPPHGRLLFFDNQQTAQIVMALLNSSLFYLWFTIYSDGFHLSHKLVKDFPTGTSFYDVREIAELATRLERDVAMHARMSSRNGRSSSIQQKQNDLIQIEEYRMAQSKTILDQIDMALADYYGLNDQDVSFIIHYDLKYRIGKKEAQELYTQ